MCVCVCVCVCLCARMSADKKSKIRILVSSQLAVVERSTAHTSANSRTWTSQIPRAGKTNLTYRKCYSEACPKHHLYIRTTCLQRPLWTDPQTTKLVLLHLYMRTTSLQRPLWTGPGTTKSVLLHLYIRTTCL